MTHVVYVVGDGGDVGRAAEAGLLVCGPRSDQRKGERGTQDVFCMYGLQQAAGNGAQLKAATHTHTTGRARLGLFFKSFHFFAISWNVSGFRMLLYESEMFSTRSKTGIEVQKPTEDRNLKQIVFQTGRTETFPDNPGAVFFYYPKVFCGLKHICTVF